MFGKKKSEITMIREDCDKIVELLSRKIKQNEILINQNKLLLERIELTKGAVEQSKDSDTAQQKPEVTPRQIINEWYYTEEELKQNGTVRE